MRQYACPRCYLVAPGLYELEVGDGLDPVRRLECCHECTAELVAEGARDLSMYVAVQGERGKPIAFARPRAVGE